MRQVSRALKEHAVITAHKAAAQRFARAIGWYNKNVLEVDAGIHGIGWMVCELRLDGRFRVPLRQGTLAIVNYSRELASPVMEIEEYQDISPTRSEKVSKAFLDKRWNKSTEG